MPLGPGKYDAAATMAREITRAKGVVLIVLEGYAGHGFDVQIPPNLSKQLPALLRDMADKIERDQNGTRN